MIDSLKNQGQDLLTLESLRKSTAIEIAIVECSIDDVEKYHLTREKMLQSLNLGIWDCRKKYVKRDKI